MLRSALALALCAAGLSFSTSAAAGGPIALTVTVKNTEGCHSGHSLRLGADEVRAIATGALARKGYTIAASPQQAPLGLEAVVQVNYCQNVGGGDIIGYAAVVGMYGLSQGSSAVTDLKRVPFNWGNKFIAHGGPAYNDQEGRVRNDLRRGIEEWIAATF